MDVLILDVLIDRASNHKKAYTFSPESIFLVFLSGTTFPAYPGLLAPAGEAGA